MKKKRKITKLTQASKLPGESLDITVEQIEKLKSLFPHAVKDDQVDFNGGKQYFAVDEGKVIICLEEKITKGLVEKITRAKPQKFLCLDRAFGNNDQLKTNTALQTEAEKIEFKVI